MNRHLHLTWIFSLLLVFSCPAQTARRLEVNRVIDSIQSYVNRSSPERIYLHTDRGGYLSADTVWFKAYVFDGATLAATTRSGILYVELLSDSNAVVSRQMFPVVQGLGSGSFVLPESLRQGTYVLRAYTKWVRNWGEGYFFAKELFVGTPAAGDWLLNYRTSLAAPGQPNRLRLDLRFRQLDQTLVGLREMRLQVTSGKKTLFRTNTETGLDGDATLDVDLPGAGAPPRLILTIQDRRKSGDRQAIRMPLVLNRPEQRDLQFLPEGGQLVAGLPAIVAFKALNEDGTAAAVEGEVIDQNGQSLLHFSSAHLGMGKFRLTPQPGYAYRARVALPNGQKKIYQLPPVQDKGVSISVTNEYEQDSCSFRVLVTGDSTMHNRPYVLVGHTRGIVAFAAAVNLSKGFATVQVNKTAFPSGVARVVLLDGNKAPLAERAFFIDHRDALQLQVTANKPRYKLRDSVALALSVVDQKGQPVMGSFSAAVVAKNQVRADSSLADNLVSRMLLYADLRGRIEQPAYYEAAARDVVKWQHLDLLLLTQGWVKFDLAPAFKTPVAPAFAAEKEFLITGLVTNAFNKPVPGAPLSLFSKKPVFFMDTVSDAGGRFVFRGLVPVDTAAYFIQARNKKGKSFNVGIGVDLFQPPALPAEQPWRLPWFANIDTATLSTSQRQVAIKNEQESVTGIRLREVVIKGRKVVKQSKNVNGAGEADLVFDESDMIKAGQMSLGDLLRKQVKNFGERTSKAGLRYHTVNSLAMHLIIDGMDIDFFMPPGESRYEYFRHFLDYFSADEILGIEVSYSGKYQMGYTSRYLHPMATFYEHAFVEVTTRSGHGPMMKKSVGTFVYRPLPFSAPRLFYRPRYQPDSRPDGSDARTTIHWEPHLVTDRQGKATLSFFTADQPGVYRVVIQGTDLGGGLGFKTLDFTVER